MLWEAASPVGGATRAQVASPAASEREANREIARRVSQQLWSGGDVALIEELFAVDYARHGSDAEFTGRDALREAVLGLRAAIPDWNETIEDIIAEGDLVAYRYTARGTYEGQLPGLPPGAGQPIVLEGNALHRIVDGQVVETWSVFNMLAFLVQIGVMPAPAPATPAAGAAGAAGGTDPTADTEATKAVVREFAAIVDAGDWAALDTMLAPGFVDHVPDPGQGPGIEGLVQALSALRAGFPDMTCPIEAILAEGDRVVVRTTCTGTHTGTWRGVPASGASVVMPGIVFYRVADGQIADRWAQFDPFGVLLHIGAIPAPAATPAATPAV
jgi:steroid delta-isomerase-like uncharacterized protein